MKTPNRILAALLVALAFLFAATPAAFAVLASCWHIPDNTSDLGFHMRNPQFEFGTTNTVTVYSGLQKFNNSFGDANQTGGWVVFKGANSVTWSSNALNFCLNTGQNQFWSNNFSTTIFGTNEVIQYYLYLTFDGVNGVVNTYLYGGGDAGGSQTTATQSTAQASPFTVRNRPAWLYHNGNRVINPGADASHNNIECAVKSGYIGKDDTAASRYADNGRIYFTTDGSSPAGALGVGSGTTQIAPLTFDHRENDPSPAGNAMWWKGTISNAPTFTTIKYKISLWHSANNEEKFADYNTSTNNTIFSFTVGTVGDPALSINGLNADYTTTHCFVDEVAADSFPLVISFAPNTPSITNVEVFSNVNRRDRAALDANGDGIEDGIIAPSGNGIVAGDDSNYYKAYAMTDAGGGVFNYTLLATKTGAYRLTARYKVIGNTNWVWYSSNGRRDHAVVVTPKKARSVMLYELNAMNIGAQGTQDYQRSTFTDLYGGPGARAHDAVTNRFDLTYAQNLGVNWLWFQPIHPIGIVGRENDTATGSAYEVGSPYAVKNFFQINPLLSKANTRDAALQEFTNFVAAADAASMNVMLDAAFNHTAHDCELDAKGTNYFAPSASPTDEIRSFAAWVYSRTDAYDLRASGSGNVATAPDRYDFGKWNDVHDIYFGRYAALVANSAQTGNFSNEGDWFDYTIGDENTSGSGNGHFDAVTRNVWRYFADYVLYWLDKTGCPNGTPANLTAKGIDGLRADFGQGLPPQCWEYIINKTRARKWDFVFMSESLDGGAVTYRSNRHFDMLNENIVFPLKAAASAGDYRSIFESRRANYGQSLVLLNSTSHDEETYDDPFQALIRHLVCGSVDGAPMIFYGQELGITRTSGFDRYELNFGKNIPHFKKFNSLQPIFTNRANGVDFIFPVYAAVNQARQFSPALRSSNRWFIDQTSGSSQPNIFSVAKYETANASPNQADVVFGFANLDRNNNQTGTFNVNITQNGGNLFGIKSNRTYNVKNISAYTASDPNRRNVWLWPNEIAGGRAGSNILSGGIYVGMSKVPTMDTSANTNDPAWNQHPFEAQYLKLYDVTPPPTPGTPAPPAAYVVGTSVTFTWSNVVDSDGGISGYHVLVGTNPTGSNVFNGTVAVISNTVSGSYGQTLYARVAAVNNAGIEGALSGASSGTILLDPALDSDGDGMSNAAEAAAGTNPLDSTSRLQILNITPSHLLTWSSVSGKTYTVMGTTSLLTGFTAISGVITSAAPTTAYTDATATNKAKFYRVKLGP